MLQAWEEEIEVLWNLETSCTGKRVDVLVPGFRHVWIVTTGEGVYVAKKLCSSSALQEAKYLKELEHPNINVLICVEPGTGQSDWILKVEYCQHGSLYSYLKTKPHPDFVSTKLLLWLQQLLCALVHMHSKNVVHCDIKSQNIFIKTWEKVVFGDFGLAEDSDSDGKCEYGSGGTPYILPPEQFDATDKLIEPPPSTDRSDVWSLGCVVHELMYGLSEGNDAGKSIVELVREGLLDRPDDVPVKPEHAHCREIATKIRAQALKLLPAERPRAEALQNTMNMLIAEERPVKRQKTHEIDSPPQYPQ